MSLPTNATPIQPSEADALLLAKALVDHGYQAHVHEIAHGPKGAPAVVVAGFYVMTDASADFIAGIIRQYELAALAVAMRTPNGRGA